MALGTRQYIQNSNIPASKILSFSVKQFNGGLNNATELQDNEAFDIMNMSFTDGIYMEKRTGLTDSLLLNPLPSNDTLYDSVLSLLVDSQGSTLISSVNTNIVFVDKFRPYSGEHIMLYATDDKLYKILNKESVELCNLNGKMRGKNFFGKYYFVDGDELRVFDGDTIKKVINPPTGFTPLPSPAIIGVINSNATEIWYEPCALQIADTALGANIIPTNPSFIEIRKNRLYISGASGVNNNTVYISDIENPLYFATLLPLQPTPNGEVITGLKNFHDTMVVARNESFFAIYGSSNLSTSSDQFSVKQINTHTGCASQDTMQIMNNYMVYLGSDGVVYRMVTPLTDVRQITTEILSVKIDLRFPPLNFNINNLSSATASFYDGEYFLKLQDRILIYNYRHMAWTVYSDINTSFLFIMDNVRYFACNDGKIYRQKVYRNDINNSMTPYEINEILTAFSDGDGESRVAIEAYYKTKRMDFNEPSYYKFFRDVFITSKVYSALKSTTDLTFELDYNDVTGQFSSTMSISVFGVSKFGDVFINREIVDSIPVRIGRRARTIALKAHNTYLDQPFRLIEINGDYTLRGRR